MGGRGSSFRQIIAESTRNKNLNLGDYFKDKETTKQNKLTKSLKNYNIMVCESTDTMNEQLLNSNLQQVEKLSKKYSGLLSKEPEHELHIRNYPMSDNTIACYARIDPDLTQSQICYNKKLVKDVEDMNTKIKHQIQVGFSASAENKTDYVITHEFGHYLERNIIEKRFQKDIRQYVRFKNLGSKEAEKVINEEADRIYVEIDKIARTKYNNYQLGVSDYSLQENSKEWFAEVFASAHTNSSYKPPLAKAMIDFLKKELKSYDV
mgnify:FL=1